MKRRNLMKAFVALGAGSAAASAASLKPIQLHTDLEVKPEAEKQLLEDFDKLFLPRIRKAPGFIDAKLLKFRKANDATG